MKKLTPIAFWSNTVNNYLSSLYNIVLNQKSILLKIENNEITFKSDRVEISKPPLYLLILKL